MTQTLTATVFNDMSPGEVHALLGPESVPVMAHAERWGMATLRSAIVTHTGYERGTSEYNAATALYRVSFAE